MVNGVGLWTWMGISLLGYGESADLQAMKTHRPATPARRTGRRFPSPIVCAVTEISLLCLNATLPGQQTALFHHRPAGYGVFSSV